MHLEGMGTRDFDLARLREIYTEIALRFDPDYLEIVRDRAEIALRSHPSAHPDLFNISHQLPGT